MTTAAAPNPEPTTAAAPNPEPTTAAAPNPEPTTTAAPNPEPTTAAAPNPEPTTAAPNPAEVTPPDYELALPEGMTAEQVNTDAFKAFAKDLGLDPVADKERVQKLFDKSIEQERTFHTNLETKNKEIVDGWIAEARADKDLGGDNFDANMALGKEALQKFGTPELTTFLEASGLGNHPEVLRFALNIAKATQNDNTIVHGNAPAPRGGLAAMYDNATSKHT